VVVDNSTTPTDPNPIEDDMRILLTAEQHEEFREICVEHVEELLEEEKIDEEGAKGLIENYKHILEEVSNTSNMELYYKTLDECYGFVEEDGEEEEEEEEVVEEEDP
jgi:hypothetical protein